MVMQIIAMPQGAREALDMIEDDEVREAVMYVRRELCTLSTRKYVDAFDRSLTIIKLELGQPDHELQELLAIGLEEMVAFAQSYTLNSRAWETGFAPYDPKGKKK